MRSLLLGALAGLVLGLVGVGVFSTVLVHKQMRAVRRGWNPVPVVVVNRDMKAGETIHYDDIAQRNLPEQFVTESDVSANDAPIVVNQPLTLDVSMGDPLTWPDFIDTHRRDRIQACVAEVLTPFRQAAKQSLEDALHDLTSHPPEIVDAPLSPIPRLTVDAAGQTQVVIATQDIREGEPINRAALKIASVPKELTTAENVPADALEQIVGAVAVVSLQAKDAVRWEFLGDAAGTASSARCVSKVFDIRHDRSSAVAKARAAAFFARSAEGH